MKQSLQKNKLSKIPKSKKSKINFEFSLKAKNRFSRLKYDSINKETLDGSYVDTVFFKPDSLNNSKTSFDKNNSLGKIDNNKLLVFTSSLKYPFNSKKSSQNFSKGKFSKKTFDLSEENTSNIEKSNTLLHNDGNELYENYLEEDDTNRIDYRIYPKIPEIETNKENKYYWLATYDKLMKKSKIIKILNYYTEVVNCKTKDKELYDEQFNFKEKSMIIPGFEIYFLENFNKPFIRPKKSGKIFIKLYLLSIEQINKIFSYINRLEYKNYINDLDIITEKNLYKNLVTFNKSIYNYSTIYCLGSFMNINIYLFSHIEKNKIDENNNINDLPSSNKLAKLIKVLMVNFPDHTKNDFINYLTNFMKDNNALNERKKEISNLLISPQRNSLKYSVKNKIIANSVIKNIIKKIPANTNSSLNTPNEFNNLSESNNLNNISEINKKTLPNKINSFEFFNKISNGINIKKQISEKILKKIDSYPFSLKNKLNIINNKTSDFQNSAKAINSKNSQNKIQKIDNLSHSIKHTQLINPIKRSLTRNNTNKINMHHELIDLNKNFKNRIKNKLILNHQLNFEKKFESNKENNFNSLNKCHINNAILKTDTFIINSNNNIIKSELNNKNTRNKIHVNFNPFYYTNSNNTHNNNFIGKKPIRVLSSIRKIISQKLNNISGNSNSFFKNINISNSNSSLQGNNNHGKILNNKKFIYLSNHNSKNNTSEYITPRKSRLYYYYH
jgi:hypothetical protein